METLKTYLTFIKMIVKSRSEYKLSFITDQFANFYCYFITYSTFWVITNRFSNIGGWDFTDLSILFGTNHITYAISGAFFFGSIYCIDREVTRGGLDRLLGTRAS
jgi:ABC-2 type transport system permease protein